MIGVRYVRQGYGRQGMASQPQPRRKARRRGAWPGRDANCRRQFGAGGSDEEIFPGCKALKIHEMRMKSTTGTNRSGPGMTSGEAWECRQSHFHAVPPS